MAVTTRSPIEELDVVEFRHDLHGVRAGTRAARSSRRGPSMTITRLRWQTLRAAASSSQRMLRTCGGRLLVTGGKSLAVRWSCWSRLGSRGCLTGFATGVIPDTCRPGPSGLARTL
jgi:hypothetical protein